LALNSVSSLKVPESIPRARDMYVITPMFSRWQ